MQKLRQVEAEIMPIKIPDKLPAAKVLKSEGVQVMAESRALRQDIRPLEIVILNLMPEKIKNRDAARATARRDTAADQCDLFTHSQL